MRDPKRIDRIIGLLRTAWKNNPDWRLGQLVVNLSSFAGVFPTPDTFYIEDEDSEKGLRYMLNLKPPPAPAPGEKS